MMSPAELGFLFGFSIFTGALNTVAGGGSLMVLPLLIYMGLPPNIANATNRVSLFSQCLSAPYLFYKQKALSKRRFLLWDHFGCNWLPNFNVHANFCASTNCWLDKSMEGDALRSTK